MKTTVLRPFLIAGVLASTVGVGAPAALGAHFTSPSRNIDCRVSGTGGGVATCNVAKHNWSSVKRKPASCRLAWFPTDVSLVRRATTVGGCRGDIGPMCLPGSPCTVLAYGRSITVKGIRCTSLTSGVVCRRTDTMRMQGFKVSRQRVTVYR